MIIRETELMNKNVYAFEAVDSETETVLGYGELRAVNGPVPVFYCRVKEEFWGKHIGTELLKHAVAYARNGGFEGVFARFEPTNVRAKMMLKGQGFKLYAKDIGLISF